MQENLKRKNDQSLPIGWPNDVPLPTKEVAENAVKEGEKLIEERLESLKGKIGGPTPEMLNTIIDI